MLQLSETFPTLDCSQCILTPRMVEVARHKKIKLYTWSEVDAVDGYIGNFEITIRMKPRSVDLAKCTGCGTCWQKCPSRTIPSEFNAGITVPDPENPKKRLGYRTAIYTPCPQAVPNKPVIDRANCLWFQKGKCGVCAKVCPTDAVDYAMEDEEVTEQVGAIVVATGFDLFDHSVYGEYGAGRYPDVISGLQYERILSASGPYGGHIRRPSDGSEPRTVVFISCVGSRDLSVDRPYCSGICCMAQAKQAILTRDHLPDSRCYVFYMDIRSPGKGYDEFVRRAQEEYGVHYVRGRVGKVYPRGDRLVVQGG